MAGVITRSAHPAALWPGVKAHFGLAYKEKPEQYSQVFMMDKSKKHYEEDVESTGFGLAVVKPEGESIAYDSSQQGYTSRYQHVTYGLGCVVTREAIEDNLYSEKAMAGARALAFGMRQTKEIVHANHFNRAFDPAFPGGDGAAMCSATHNTLAGDASNVLAVAADLSEASLEQALIDIRCINNSRGLQISVQGEKLIVPKQLQFIAERIIETNLRVGTDLNDVNAIKSMGLIPQGIMVWDYLTDPDAWFLKTSVMHGLKCYQRRAREFKRDNDFDTENAKMKTTERYSFGHSDWRGVFGSSGA